MKYCTSDKQVKYPVRYCTLDKHSACSPWQTPGTSSTSLRKLSLSLISSWKLIDTPHLVSLSVLGPKPKDLIHRQLRRLLRT